jgi:hypothetical protein
MTARHVAGAIALSAVSLLGGYAIGHARQQVHPGFVYLTHYEIPFERVDSLQKLIRTYSIPMTDEAKKSGTLLDEKWLIHHTGTEYNVLQIRHWRNWEAINADTTIGRAMRRLWPDSGRRVDINRAFGEMLAGAHRDAIYVPVVR